MKLRTRLAKAWEGWKARPSGAPLSSDNVLYVANTVTVQDETRGRCHTGWGNDLPYILRGVSGTAWAAAVREILGTPTTAAALARFEDEMGGELAGSTLDSYDLGRARDAAARGTMAAALDTCRAYVDQPRGWLYLYGPTGVGKSHLAAATSRAIT